MQINHPKSYAISDRQKGGEEGAQVTAHTGDSLALLFQSWVPLDVAPPIFTFIRRELSHKVTVRIDTGTDGQSRGPPPLPSPGTNAMEYTQDEQDYSRVEWSLAQQKSTS